MIWKKETWEGKYIYMYIYGITFM